METSAGVPELTDSASLPHSSTPPPLALLINLLGSQPDLQTLHHSNSWAAVRDIAIANGVATVLAGIARPHLPAQGRIWCDQILRESWLRHEQSLLDLEAVLAILDHAGVQPLVLKGPILARRYYTLPYTRRPSGDIDLAVRSTDLERACSALVQQGYAMKGTIREARLRTHHIELICPDRPRVELHFRLSHGAYGIPVDAFFDRAVPYNSPCGRTVAVLDPADQLMHLVLHFAHGRFIRLFHLYEIRHIWDSAPFEVRRDALNRAASYHFSGTFALTNAAFEARWKTPMLTESMPFRKTWLQGLWGADFYNNFERAFSNPAPQLPFGTRLLRRWLDLQLTDRPTDALRVLGVFIRAAVWQVVGKRGPL